MKKLKGFLGVAMLSVITAAALFINAQYIPGITKETQPIAIGSTATDINNSNSQEDPLVLSRLTRMPMHATMQQSTTVTAPQPPETKKVADNQVASHKVTVTKAAKRSIPSQSSSSSSSTAVGTSSSLASNEIDLFSRLVSAEAAAESFEGKLAVATVIMNRVNNPNYPKTISGVILDKSWGYQFTPVADGRINLPATTDSKKAVQMVLNGFRSFSSNILFFVNPITATNTYVTKNRTFFKAIGNHQFYY